MKKVIALFSVFVMVICMSSCSSNSSALKMSTESYKIVETAYTAIDEFAETIRKAWYVGINSSDELRGKTSKRGSSYYSYYSGYYTTYDYSKGMEYLAEKTGVSFDDLKKGIAYEKYGEEYAEYISVSDASKMDEVYKSVLDSYGSEGSACIYIIISTYKATGKHAIIEAHISSAKASVKKLGEKYSDYAYFDDIKDYYITAQMYFDFCNNLAGSTYDETTARFNEYKNLANQCRYSLGLFLEEETNSK